MKKGFISFLIMTLTLANMSLVNISSVQAATTDTSSTGNTSTATDNTIKVSLENIRDIMIENNLDLKIEDNNLKIAKENRDDATTKLDSLKGSDDQATAEKKLSDAASSAQTDVDNNTDYSLLKGLQNTLTTAKKALSDFTSAEDKVTTTKAAYKTAKTDYDKKVESVVYSAQTAYLNYLSDSATEKINEDTVKSKEKAAQVYKLQYESGFISKNTYIDNLQANTSVNDLTSSKDKVELERIQLCNTLGISPEEKVTFDTDINEDFLAISKINYEDDLNQMLDNNLDIKDQNDAIDNLDDTEDDYTNDNVYDYTVDNAGIKLKQLIQDKDAQFKGKYNDLMASYNSLKSSYDVIIQEQKEYQVTRIQYDYGFISKNALDTGLNNGSNNKKLDLDTKMAKFIKDRNACYLLYLKYIEMKEGYTVE